MELIFLVLGLWVAPSILLSAIVVYQALRHDWREASPVAWTGRAYGIVGMDQLVEVAPTRRAARPAARSVDNMETNRTREDRAGVQLRAADRSPSPSKRTGAAPEAPRRSAFGSRQAD